MGQYRPVLANRRARSLFLSAAVSGLGDWIGLAGLVVLAYERTSSTLGAGALFAVQGVAALAATVLIGPKLDRVDRRIGLVGCYAIGGVSLLLPIAAGGLWPLLVTAGVTGALRPTSAALRHAIAAVDLPEPLLGPVVALQKATGDATAAIGLAAGGIVTVLLGATLSLGLDAATFAVAAVLALALPSGRSEVDVPRNVLTGVRLWFTDQRMGFSLLVLVALAAVSALPETLAPEASAGTGWLPAVIAAQALGSAIGGFVLGHRQHLEDRAPLIIGLTAVSGTLALGSFAVLVHPAALAAANLLLGIALGVAVLAQTAFTRAAPKDLIGAAVASAITAVMVAEGIGSFLLGAIADAVGPAAAYGTAAAGLCVVTLAIATRSAQVRVRS